MTNKFDKNPDKMNTIDLGKNLLEYREFLDSKYSNVVTTTLTDDFFIKLRSLSEFEVEAFFKIYEKEFTALRDETIRFSTIFLIYLSSFVISAIVCIAIDYANIKIMAYNGIYPTMLLHLIFVWFSFVLATFSGTIYLKAKSKNIKNETTKLSNHAIALEALEKVKNKKLGKLALYKKLTDALYDENTTGSGIGDKLDDIDKNLDIPDYYNTYKDKIDYEEQKFMEKLNIQEEQNTQKEQKIEIPDVTYTTRQRKRRHK